MKRKACLFHFFSFAISRCVCSSTSFCGWNLLKYHAEPNIVDGGSNQSTADSSPPHCVSVALIPLQRSTSRIHFFIAFRLNPFFPLSAIHRMEIWREHCIHFHLYSTLRLFLEFTEKKTHTNFNIHKVYFFASLCLCLFALLRSLNNIRVAFIHPCFEHLLFFCRFANKLAWCIIGWLVIAAAATVTTIASLLFCAFSSFWHLNMVSMGFLLLSKRSTWYSTMHMSYFLCYACQSTQTNSHHKLSLLLRTFFVLFLSLARRLLSSLSLYSNRAWLFRTPVIVSNTLRSGHFCLVFNLLSAHL